MNNPSNPDISVILPTFNRPKLLARAVKTVLEQSFKNFELLVIDDASTTDVRPAIEELRDVRIKLIRHSVNRGGSAARNTGLRAAQAPLIAFLDDDDEWYPRKLELQYQKMLQSKSDVGLIYCGQEIFNADTGKLWRVNKPVLRGDLRGKFLEGQKIGGIPVLVRKECFDRVGVFDESLSSCQDWDMWKRLSEFYEFDYVPDILTKVYLHQNQISSDLNALIAGRARMIEKHMEEFKKYPDILATHYKRMGKLCALNKDWKQSWAWFRKAVRLNPFEILKILAWMAIEFPAVKFSSRFKNYKKI